MARPTPPPTALAKAFEASRKAASAHAAANAALESAYHIEMAAMEDDRRALHDARAAFQKDKEDAATRFLEEQTRLRSTAPPPDDKIKLNVGGARFETSRSVLTKVDDSMLGRMFGRCDSMLQADPEDGSIFIDRDGERFRFLLDFLRGDPLDGRRMQRMIRALPEAQQDAVVQELDYFGLESAVFGGRPWTDDRTFTIGPDMSEGRFGCAAVLAGRVVVVVGGYAAALAIKTTLLLDCETLTYAPGPEMINGRYGCAAVTMDDRVLVVGGRDDNAESFDTTEVFHVESRTFTQGPPMQASRGYCAAIALDSRRILVVGGYDGDMELSSTEILSLDTMAFSQGPTLAAPRYGCAAIALDDHRVMVVGGRLRSGPLNTTEVLDLRTMSFSPGPYMSSARDGCAAVSVDARHVLVIGGWNSSSTPLATTELLDVITMQFEPGPTLQCGARWGCAAARLDENEDPPRILVLGGRSASGVDLASTEALFDDASRAARAARREGSPRFDQNSPRLSNQSPR